MHTDVLKEIQEAEAEARRIDGEGTEKRRAILSEARENAQKKAEEMKRGAQEEGKGFIAARTEEAEAEARRIVQQGKERLEEIERLAGDKTAQASQCVVEKLLG